MVSLGFRPPPTCVSSRCAGAALLGAMVVCTAPARGACRVAGNRVELSDVMVRSSAGESFRVDVSGYLPDAHGASAVAVLPESPAGVTRVDVTGAIAFRGTRKNPLLALREPRTTSSGAVLLEAGAVVTKAWTRGAAVIATVPFAVDDPERLSRGLDVAEAITNVPLPCEALTLDLPTATDDGTTAFASFFGDFTDLPPVVRLRKSALRVVLRDGPAWSAKTLAVSRSVGQPPSEFTFWRLAESGAWTKVFHTGSGWANRVGVFGWLPTAALESADTYAVDAGTAEPQAGNCSFFRRGNTQSSWAYDGPATIAVGTPIHTQPARGTWATVREGVPFHVQYRSGDTWAHIDRIPGVSMTACWEPLPAYVPLSAVTAVH